MKKLIFLAFILGFSVCLSAQKINKQILGFQIGETSEQQLLDSLTARKIKISETYERKNSKFYRTGGATFAKTDFTEVLFCFYKNKLLFINMSVDDPTKFGLLKDALTNKYNSFLKKSEDSNFLDFEDEETMIWLSNVVGTTSLKYLSKNLSKQTELDAIPGALSGFWGIDFGSSMTQAKSILDSKKGSTYSNESKKDKLIYMGGTFAGEDINFVTVDFFKGKLYQGIVSINPSSESQVISTYESLKESLTSKYFEPQKKIEKFDYPFEKGDGHEITAIKADKANFFSLWTFENATILLIISNDAKIAIFYTDTATENIIKEIEAGKNKNDL